MRPTLFSADVLRRFLRKNRIATLRQLKDLLGTEADITVFRKLKELSYRTSYSHRGSFYTLDEIATFDERGLWSFDSVWFSRHGTLVATAEERVTQSEAGYFAFELEDVLHVPVKEPLLQLVAQGRIARQPISGLYLYCASQPRTRQQQLRARQSLPDQAAATSVGIAASSVSDELRAAMSCSPACRKWWLREGRRRYPQSSHILILADTGGSNGAQRGAWKQEIQRQLCDGLGLSVTLSHYPSGASKWNPIEHRLFSQISRNWAAEPLDSYEKALKFIRTTTTTTGLKVTAQLDTTYYPTGVKPSKAELKQISIHKKRVLPKWNYTISLLSGYKSNRISCLVFSGRSVWERPS